MNKQTVIFIAIGLLILVALGYFLFKPAPKQEVPNQDLITNNQIEAQPLTPTDMVEAEFTYTSSNYEPKSVQVQQGQKVILKITSDIDDEAHLHGYDLSEPLVAGQLVTIEFIADKTGRFDLELEKLGKSLGVIAVYPK